MVHIRNPGLIVPACSNTMRTANTATPSTVVPVFASGSASLQSDS